MIVIGSAPVLVSLTVPVACLFVETVPRFSRTGSSRSVESAGCVVDDTVRETGAVSVVAAACLAASCLAACCLSASAFSRLASLTNGFGSVASGAGFSLFTGVGAGSAALAFVAVAWGELS